MDTIEKEFSAAKLWFDAIASAVGKQKLNIIKQCKEANDDGWVMLIRYLNPYMMFHIREKTMESDVAPSEDRFANSEQMFTCLTAQKGLTNALLAKVKATLGVIENPLIRAFACDYAARKIKIGVTAESVNKAVSENVIPTFGCMLANKYFEHQKYIVGKRIVVTEKLDGIRALTMVTPSIDENGLTSCTINIFSRQGQPITGLDEIENAIRNMTLKVFKTFKRTKPFVLDGELLISNRNNIPSKEQYKRTVKIVRTENNENKKNICYHIFDFLPQICFQSGFCKSPYGARRKMLSFLDSFNDSNVLQIVPVMTFFESNDEDATNRKILELVTNARNAGMEGIMLNDYDAPYVCARTNHLLKVKVFQDCDLQIIDIQKGNGKFEDTLGAIVVEYKGNKVSVGTGFTDEQRKEIWNNQKEYIGRVAAIQYFEETCDAKGTPSIRFPVFLEIREAGKEVSYS